MWPTDEPQMKAFSAWPGGSANAAPRSERATTSCLQGPARGVPPARRQEVHMLAALNMGLVGTIIVIAIVIAVILFFMRRA